MKDSLPDPAMATVERFRSWSDTIGVAAAAQLLGVTPSMVSHLRAGRFRPGLALAARIQRVTKRSRLGVIRAADWVGAEDARPA